MGIQPENKTIRSSKQMESILPDYMHMQPLFPPQPQKLETYHQEEIITLQSKIQRPIFTHVDYFSHFEISFLYLHLKVLIRLEFQGCVHDSIL